MLAFFRKAMQKYEENRKGKNLYPRWASSSIKELPDGIIWVQKRLCRYKS